MPLHIDVRINDELIERLHIARLTKNGMSTGAVNEYAIIRSEKEPNRTEDFTFKQSDFPREPEWHQWLAAENRFEHTYGEQSLVCLLKALEALLPEHSSAQRIKELEEENRRLREQVGR